MWAYDKSSRKTPVSPEQFMGMPTAVIDIDGVLVDWFSGFSAYLRHLGVLGKSAAFPEPRSYDIEGVLSGSAGSYYGVPAAIIKEYMGDVGVYSDESGCLTVSYPGTHGALKKLLKAGYKLIFYSAMMSQQQYLAKRNWLLRSFRILRETAGASVWSLPFCEYSSGKKEIPTEVFFEDNPDAFPIQGFGVGVPPPCKGYIIDHPYNRGFPSEAMGVKRVKTFAQGVSDLLG